MRYVFEGFLISCRDTIIELKKGWAWLREDMRGRELEVDFLVFLLGLSLFLVLGLRTL